MLPQRLACFDNNSRHPDEPHLLSYLQSLSRASDTFKPRVSILNNQQKMYNKYCFYKWQAKCNLAWCCFPFCNSFWKTTMCTTACIIRGLAHVHSRTALLIILFCFNIKLKQLLITSELAIYFSIFLFYWYINKLLKHNQISFIFV